MYVSMAGPGQSLLMWENTLLILNHGPDVLKGVRWFNLESDCLTITQGPYKKLHTSTKTEH